jgi:cyclophilin family peptidyl-prolyl cis-trans isomerase
VGVYRILGRLGAGGMGHVYLGISPGRRRVAVKVLRPEFTPDPQFRRRFSREITAARAAGGFHTAAVVDADPDGEPPWMATAYIPGPSLQTVVTEGGPLGLDEVRALGAGLAEGLAAIHGSGLIHRDLKPGNIIVAADGPRIIDFGIAHLVTANTLTATGEVFGTYAYMSPEQVSGDPVTPASDVFSLGSLLTFAATGHGPFDHPRIEVVIGRIVTTEPVLRGLDGALREVISSCLAKEPGRRPTPASLLERFADDAYEPRPPRAAGAGTSRLLATVPSVRAPTRPATARRSAGNGQRGSRPGEKLFALLRTTWGDIEIRLFADHAPQTVSNFVGLATGERAWTDPATGAVRTGVPLYDRTLFHRVIPGFVIQGGDPLGDGTGGPGYAFDDEIHPALTFDRPYLVAMANAGPATNGSQFFITVDKAPWLDHAHTIFGQVTRGTEVVDAINSVPTDQADRPTIDVVINEIAIGRVTD